MSHKANVKHIVRRAAFDVWRKQMDGTRLPHIIVKLELWGPRVRLIASEVGRPELMELEEIAVFSGGKPMWRSMAKQWRAKFPGSYEGMSLGQVYERHKKSWDKSDYAHIITEIQSALHHKGQAWLREHGLDPEFGPGAILTQYLRRGEILPAAMLAHTILYQWSHDPVLNWYEFFNLCDRLMNYRHRKQGANTVLQPEQFAQIISLCVANFSKNLNRFTAARYAMKRPLPKIYLDIHNMLRRRLLIWCNVKFNHVPDPRITAMWL